MNYLVAFHGLPRAGKGTAAEPLIARGFSRVGFGDSVYSEVARTFGVSIDELRSDDWKNNPQNLLTINCADSPVYRGMLQAAGENMNTPRTSRYHLQRWATEFRRRADPLYWVKRLGEKVRYISSDIVVDDLRFLDSEYPYLRHLAQVTGREFRVIEITAPWRAYNQHHVSDTHLPPHLIDRIFENAEGHPEVLQRAVIDYLYPHGT